MCIFALRFAGSQMFRVCLSFNVYLLCTKLNVEAATKCLLSDVRKQRSVLISPDEIKY